MAVTKIGLRGLWFQLHKWIGILLVVLIIPISVTGSALVWHDWLDAQLNPHRYAISGTELLAPSAYVAAARPRLVAGDRIASIRAGEDGGAVTLTAMRPAEGRGMPTRTNIYLDPPTARILDVADANAGVVRWLHQFHGSLLVPGIGRQIVGWIGVAMLLSCLTGLWLWWPTIGRWTRGLRWRRSNRFDDNLHHQVGFWIVLPLAMLSFTGVWISFPQWFSAIGAPPVAEGARKGPPLPDRAARMRAKPIVDPAQTPDAVVAAARAVQPGAFASIGWPTDLSSDWTVGIARGEGRPKEIKVADATGIAEAPRRGDRGPGNPVAQLMRRWHDGSGMGAIWQLLIFLGGIAPAVLGVTGIIMWLRTRGWRADVAKRRRSKAARAPVAAE